MNFPETLATPARHTRADCLATVMKSPQAVAAHDRQAWLAIFARYNIVEDPVGSAPHVSGIFDARTGERGNGPLGRFYDCFIAPMQIVFHVDRDIVCACRVVRDLTIEIHMAPQITLHVPMHLCYQLSEEDGTLKVQHLAAHWELWPMLRQQMSFGLASLVAGIALGRRMIAQLGFGGALDFMSALRNIGQTGKDRVAAFVAAFNRRDVEGMARELGNGFAGVAWPADAPLAGIERLTTLPGQLRLGKTLAAGNYISASFSLENATERQHGVMFCEFNMHEKKIQRLHFYVDAQGRDDRDETTTPG